MAIQHWDRMDSEELLLIMPKKYVMNILRNLVLRLNYKKILDLGSVNTLNLMQCLQYLVLNLHRAMFNKREKKGPRSAQKQL